jgi:hypothetical protein
MKKLVIASLFVASIGSLTAMAEEWTGYVSDAHCGAKHHEVSEANTKCVNGCLKGGDAVLVVGDKVVKLDADSSTKAKAFAGQNVKVTGALDGGVLKIDTIAKAE